jgi:glucosamine-6-phosphate deaminase
MEVIIQNDRKSACFLAAEIIAREIKETPPLVLGLATGRTMECLYAELVRRHQRDGLDFSLCRSFNLDEYIGIPPEDPHSYRHYMNTHFFDKVNIDIRNTHLPRGTAEDLEAECARYEEVIKECGGIGLQLLGIGEAGHIGFNEPLSALLSRTRQKALSPETMAQNRKLFKNPSEMPRRALTMGVGTILESKKCLLLVTGSHKAEILAQAVEGPITSMVTASALQLHPKCTVVVDSEAAVNLKGTEYYRWIFETEPEWQGF